MLCLVWDLVSPNYTLGNSQLSFLLNSAPSTHTQNDAMLKAMENNVKLGFLNTSYGSDCIFTSHLYNDLEEEILSSHFIGEETEIS